jgi:hypothetical protein
VSLRQPPDPEGDLVVQCDVAALPPDALSVDTLARVQLEARRHGCRVQLRNVPAELGRLLSFLGLADAVGLGRRLEAQRQPEEREDPRRVEEGVDRGDLPA